jgi:Flp pilus assembly protein TadG
MRSRFRRLLSDTTGVSALEFAIISPVLMTLLLGIFQVGIVMNDHLVLTNAAAQGALAIALSRGSATPFTATTAAIASASPNFTQANVAKTVTLNGTACTTDSTCAAALVAGQTATVRATYPCSLTIMGVNYAPSGCTLTAQSAQMVQ